MKDHPPVRKRAMIALAVAFLAALTDQISKVWAVHALADGHQIPLIGSRVSLVLIHNSGAAFSFGSSTTWVFTILSVLVLFVLVAIVHRGCTARVAAAIGLLAGGAAGNLADRLMRPPGVGIGHVVDFINYNGWFIGNIADIWIVLAAAWLAFEASRGGNPEK